MTTLHDALVDVQVDPSECLGQDYEAWLDEIDALELEDAPDVDQLADHLADAFNWLKSEADEIRLRARTEGDPIGALLLAANQVEAAAGDLVQRHTTRPRREPRLPASPRRSPLAEALDVLAAWYLHLDSAAGELAAYHLLWAASGADEWDSATADDYHDSQAAWLEALRADCDAAMAEREAMGVFDASEL